MRGGLLDVFPATEDRAVRVDMFDVEIESLRWFSTFTQRSLGDVEEVEIAPAAELAAEHRELAELAARTGRSRPAREAGEEAERPDVAELLPVERFMAAAGPDRSRRRGAGQRRPADRRRRGGDRAHAQGPLGRRLRRLRRHDAHHLYVSPEQIRSTLSGRARIWLSAHASDQPIELRAQSADSAARSLAEAEPELERLVRSGYRTVVAFPRRGEGERAAYNLGTPESELAGGGRRRGTRSPPTRSSRRCASRAASLREGFVAPSAEARRTTPSTGCCAAAAPSAADDRRGARRAARRGALRSFTELRDGRHRRARGPRRGALRGLRDAHGRGRHARLPVSRIPGRRPRVRAHRPAGQDLALRRRRAASAGTAARRSSAARAGRR